MKKIKATARTELASRMYRMGKINAIKETVLAVSVEFSDYIEYSECIEWDVKTLTGSAVVLTDYKGNIDCVRYYDN